MLKKLIEKHKQKKHEKMLNKPYFKLEDLYVGEIVLLQKRDFVGLLQFDCTYKPIKKFAFLYEIDRDKYRHLVSNQELLEISDIKSIVGDYALRNVLPFKEVFPIFMREYNFKESSKVSLKFIIDGEDEVNRKLAPEQKKVDLFEYPFELT